MLSRRDVLGIAAGAALMGPGLLSVQEARAATRINGFTIQGAIYDLWLPNRDLVGTPTTNEYAITGGTKQKFTGALMYTSPQGAAILRGRVRTTFGDGGGVAVLGIPIGVEARRATYATYTQRCTAGRVWWSSADGGKAVPASKTVRLRGARNFRDAAGNGSGLAVAGGRLRRGLVYRSNKLAALSGMDCAILLDLGVTRVIDLRQPATIAASPDRAIAGIARTTIDVFGSTTSSDTYEMYRMFASSAYRRGKIAEAIRTITAATGPVVLHCTYGKDRTGWIVAMIQLALGATESAVIAEWLKSNTYLGTNTLTTGHFAAGLSEAKRLFGSVEGYLSQGLGLSATVRDQLRVRLVR